MAARPPTRPSLDLRPQPHPESRARSAASIPAGLPLQALRAVPAQGSRWAAARTPSFTTDASGPPPSSRSPQPALYPAFGPSVTDYVTLRQRRRVTVSVAAPDGTTVSVDEADRQERALLAGRRPQRTGQAFADHHRQRRDYHVRCLPRRLPQLDVHALPASPSQQWYLISAGAPEPGRQEFTPRSSRQARRAGLVLRSVGSAARYRAASRRQHRHGPVLLPAGLRGEQQHGV